MSEVDCPRAKSDMTPCVARDGHIACADDGVCVGCGQHPADLLTDLVPRYVAVKAGLAAAEKRGAEARDREWASVAADALVEPIKTPEDLRAVVDRDSKEQEREVTDAIADERAEWNAAVQNWVSDGQYLSGAIDTDAARRFVVLACLSSKAERMQRERIASKVRERLERNSGELPRARAEGAQAK